MTKLYAYQEEGVALLEANGGRAILADSMGLGKTIQALTYIARNKNDTLPAVIVVPASLKGNWENEARLHVGMRVTILNGTKPDASRLTGAQVIVINYDILHAWLKLLAKLKPQLVICDESHYCKSHSTRRTKAVKLLVSTTNKFIAISGTALTSRPIELWPILNMLRPKKFNSRHQFGRKFCRARFNFGRWDYSGASNLKSLNRLLLKCGMIRRLKADVLKDLPPKQRIVVPITLDTAAKKEYDEAAVDTIGWLRKVFGNRAAERSMRAEALVRIGHLKRLAARLKLKYLLEWVDNFLASSDEKVILFGVHKAMIKAFHDKYGDICAVVTGEVTGEKRTKQFAKFNTSKKCRIFLGNIQAAGVGWSASACSTVVFLEMAWSPGEHTQAEDRVHGIGRGVEGIQSQSYWMVAAGTIEEKLCQILEKKQKNLDTVLDGKKTAEDLDIYNQLIEYLTGNK